VQAPLTVWWTLLAKRCRLPLSSDISATSAGHPDRWRTAIMDPASLKSLADAAGQANQAGAAPREPDPGALPETGHERKPSRRKRSARPSAARHSESPEVRVAPLVVRIQPLAPWLMTLV
jgi:hypothetical protein